MLTVQALSPQEQRPCCCVPAEMASEHAAPVADAALRQSYASPPHGSAWSPQQLADLRSFLGADGLLDGYHDTHGGGTTSAGAPVCMRATAAMRFWLMRC
jgi:hypothetical protein